MKGYGSGLLQGRYISQRLPAGAVESHKKAWVSLADLRPGKVPGEKKRTTEYLARNTVSGF
jgi:hypothetical protein